jgi:hypothetical protein
MCSISAHSRLGNLPFSDSSLLDCSGQDQLGVLDALKKPSRTNGVQKEPAMRGHKPCSLPLRASTEAETGFAPLTHQAN